MRIVAGKYRGKKLATPSGNAIRPTTDRVRESLFNILEHHDNIPPLQDARILDLFAGSGALGLEAISRGAGYCLFIEQSADARGLIRDNVERLELTGQTRIFRRDATNLGKSGTCGTFSFIFSDPPYGQELAEKSMQSALSGNWLEQGAIWIVEENKNADLMMPAGFSPLEERTYGDTKIMIFEYSQ